MKIMKICRLNNLGMTPPAAGSSYGMKMKLFSFGNIILLKEKGGMRESFPRQVDEKSGSPQGERGLEISRRKKGQTFFFLYIP